MRALTLPFTLSGMPAADPADIWDLLRRADDLVKYAEHHPDPNVSYDNARGLLAEALNLANTMSPGQAEFFHAQIDWRYRDLSKLKSE
jgi:hypothetical protein